MNAKLGFLITLWASALLLGIVSSCDNKKDRTDFESMQILYLILNRPVNLQQSCVDTQTSAFQCATNSAIPGATEIYVSTMEGIYRISVVAPRDETSLCNALLDAQTFPDPTNDGTTTYSPGAKDCHLACQKGYWDRVILAGSCTASNYPTLSPFSDTTYQECLTDCFTTGTILPP